MKNPSVTTTLARLLRKVLSRAKKQPKLARKLRGIEQVGVCAVSPAEIARLNRRYRGKAKPTDVLSFPAPGALRKLGDLGDLVICASVARKQARERGHALEREFEVLVVHGFLHLLGFDHERSSRGAAEMRRWERRLLGPKNCGLLERAASGMLTTAKETL